MELSEKGLIALSNDPTDRRKQILSLTSVGIEHLRSGLPHSLEREAKLRGRLTDEEYTSFGRVLSLLEDEANKLLEEIKRQG